MCNFEYNYVQQGWQCPICKNVFAPSVQMCTVCNKETKVITSYNTQTKKKMCYNCGKVYVVSPSYIDDKCSCGGTLS